MPKKPPHPCSSPGCPALTHNRYCEQHTAIERKRPRSGRCGNMYNYRWQKARAAFLRAHPICCVCEREAIIEPSAVVDHKIPHEGNQTLFWDESNWQAMCVQCHNRKSARELNEKKGKVLII